MQTIDVKAARACEAPYDKPMADTGPSVVKETNRGVTIFDGWTTLKVQKLDTAEALRRANLRALCIQRRQVRKRIISDIRDPFAIQAKIAEDTRKSYEEEA